MRLGFNNTELRIQKSVHLNQREVKFGIVGNLTFFFGSRRPEKIFFLKKVNFGTKKGGNSLRWEGDSDQKLS